MPPSFLTREITRAPTGPRVGAFFDVDGTLIAGFSAANFWRDRLRAGQLGARDVLESLYMLLDFQRGRVGFSGLLGVLAGLLRGVAEKELEETGERLYRDEIAALVYPESRALVEAHLAAGHTVAIVSAATRYQVEPIARDFGVTHVLCSQLEVEDGRFTGRAAEPYNWGEGKLRSVDTFAADRGVDLAESFFYTDGSEDLPLLRAVGRPRPTNPDGALAEAARRMAWPVQRFTSRGRPGVRDVLRTGLVAAALPQVLALGLPAALISGRKRSFLNAAISAWGELGTALAGVSLRVHGEDHLWAERPAVFIFNHQSAIDVLLLCKLLRQDFAGVAKKELKDVPLFGQVAEFADTVFLDRSNTKEAIAALEPAIAMLKRGTSLVIAPEGTRSTGPRLSRFKKGAFHVALEARVPIVPIVFHNAYAALPKHGLVIRPAEVEVTVLPPVSTRKWLRHELDEEIADIYRAYERTLGTPIPD